MASSSSSKRGPRGRTGPGRRPSAARRAPAARPAAAAAGPARPARPTAPRPRQKLTGRAAVLVLVLAVLTVSYASSMRAYLQQRSHINDLKASIAEHDANIDELVAEKKRWEDPAYVEKQARARLGYVLPGEKAYMVLGEDGTPLEPETELKDPATVLTSRPVAWYDTAWQSVELAGHPPRVGRPPSTEIDGTRKGTGGEDSAGESPE
jgi:cell division protein FtsB